MARPREFDLNEAIERAMDLFWTHGYSSTSLPDLLEGMAITRGSFYKAFISKKELFLKALQRYENTVLEPALTRLHDENIAGTTRLQSIFTGAVNAAKNGETRGCLLCTTSAGAALNDAEIAERVNNQLERLTQGLAKALADAGNATPEQTARSLTLSYIGLRIATRGQMSAERLEIAANQALAQVS
ncbi:TetR/AcrR family transcriptional regulator [Pseudahrensia aquimaris]|uniref:TetR/AcrR family transcriptional regulator n=1 Tax=Pseudahrensia aquimaris TaxID=744461 RepID=A0ABW3FHM3_9HYPH